MRAYALHEVWDKAGRAVGVEHIHFRDLAATLAASTGASTKELMYRLCHASHQAALRYQHATQERDRAVADGLDLIVRANRPTRKR